MEDRISGVALRTGDVGGSLARFRDAVNLAREVGCSHIEVTMVGLDAVVGARLNRERVDQIVAVIEQCGLAATVHGMQRVNLLDQAELEGHEAVARASIDFTAAVGARTMVLHAGHDLGPAPKTNSAVQRDALRRLGDHAASQGVRIAVETLPPMALARGSGTEDLRATDPSLLRAEIEAVDHASVCGTLDVSHVAQATTYLQRDLALAVRDFAPMAGHVHLHDSFRVPRAATYRATQSDQITYGHGDLHMPLGWGEIDWDSLVADLAYLRPGTVFVLEVLERFWDSLEPSVRRAWRLAQQINAAAGPTSARGS